MKYTCIDCGIQFECTRQAYRCVDCRKVRKLELEKKWIEEHRQHYNALVYDFKKRNPEKVAAEQKRAKEKRREEQASGIITDNRQVRYKVIYDPIPEEEGGLVGLIIQPLELEYGVKFDSFLPGMKLKNLITEEVVVL